MAALRGYGLRNTASPSVIVDMLEEPGRGSHMGDDCERRQVADCGDKGGRGPAARRRPGGRGPDGSHGPRAGRPRAGPLRSSRWARGRQADGSPGRWPPDPTKRSQHFGQRFEW